MNGMTFKKADTVISNGNYSETAACVLFLIGLILFPIHLRYALLSGKIGLYARLNIPFLCAVVILLWTKRMKAQYTRSDVLMLLVWLGCAVLMVLSNYGIWRRYTVVAFLNLLFPAVILLYRFERAAFEKFMKLFLAVFDVFIVVLLVCAVIERYCGNIILTTVVSLISSSEYTAYLGWAQSGVWRFYSLWGHALTNAVFFNAFFIVNDLYFRSRGKRYPKLLFFLAALLGVAFCSSKSAIVILFVYMILSCLKDQKRILLGGGIIAGIVLALGGFDILLQRFASTTLTTGRLETFRVYLERGDYPLRFFTGYGSGALYMKMADLKAGFEFPVFMDSLDYGILYAILLLGGLYVYVSWKMLGRRSVLCWMGFSLLYLQCNTYNGIALSNQDCFMWMCVFVMIMINCSLTGVVATLK